MSSLLWDATLPFYVACFYLKSWRSRAGYIGLTIFIWMFYHWAYHNLDTGLFPITLVYWMVVFFCLSVVFGVIGNWILRKKMFDPLPDIVWVGIGLCIWMLGYYFAIEIIRQTAHNFPPIGC